MVAKGRSHYRAWSQSPPSLRWLAPALVSLVPITPLRSLNKEKLVAATTTTNFLIMNDHLSHE